MPLYYLCLSFSSLPTRIYLPIHLHKEQKLVCMKQSRWFEPTTKRRWAHSKTNTLNHEIEFDLYELQLFLYRRERLLPCCTEIWLWVVEKQPIASPNRAKMVGCLADRKVCTFDKDDKWLRIDWSSKKSNYSSAFPFKKSYINTCKRTTIRILWTSL